MKNDKELALLIGKKIQKLRKATGFSQEGFAYHINMNKGFYSKIERGQAVPSILNFVKIAKALEVTPNDLLPKECGVSEK
jgi:transcriptional regulator with XRE-family HTH domain